MSPAESKRHAQEEAGAQIGKAAAAKKCWTCGCLRDSAVAIERGLPTGKRLPVLDAALAAALERVGERRYDCLGCAVCFPALAVNALNEAYGEEAVGAESCPTETVQLRDGWPPLPGSFTTLRYRAPVAVCTLTDDDLAADVVRAAPQGVAIVGTLQTENLGIERLVQNLIANPYVRFLVLCGADTRQAVGHLPGQSLIALSRSGLDQRARIVGAKGKRPYLRNLPEGAAEHFLRTVEVVDLVGNGTSSEILAAIRGCQQRDPGPAPAFDAARVIQPEMGYLPDRMVPDPAGYFVVYVDRERRLLSLEHYAKDGLLDHVIEGRNAAELYVPAVEKGLLTRLDHAAYLGRELARGEQALRTGEDYVQDAAAELAPATANACGPSCGSSCE